MGAGMWAEQIPADPWLVGPPLDEDDSPETVALVEAGLPNGGAA